MLRYSAIGVVIGLLAATGLQASTDPVKEIATGWGYTCALVSSGAVYCWGTAWVNGSDTNSASPVLVNELSKVKAIGAGLGNTCAIDLTGQTWCWGTDWKESIERKGWVKTRIPKLMEGLPSASQIAVGWSHICVISEVDGSVWCWGSNGVGELGNGTTDEEEKPVRVKNLAGATSIAAGVSNTCAVVAHDEVYCWGRDRQRGLVQSSTLAPQSKSKV